MTHFVLHTIISAVIHGLIYLSIWKMGRDMSILQVLALLFSVVVVVLVFALVWRVLFRRRRYR